MRSSGCFVEMTGDCLSVGNTHFRRTWRVGTNGLLYAESFHDAVAGGEWLASPPVQAAPTSPSPLMEETRTLSLRARPKSLVLEADSLTAELTASGKHLTLRYFFQIFPECRGVRMSLSVEGEAGASVALETKNPANAEPTGIETDPAGTNASNAQTRDTLESFALAPLHLRLTQVTFQDQTDTHNELVSEREWLLHPSEGPLFLSGCLFYLEDVLTGAGLIFLKEAPLPAARPVPAPHDFQVRPDTRHVTLAGHGTDGDGAGYSFVTLAYAGGKAGRIDAMQQYQRCLRPYVPTRDGMFLSNTWGDRNRDERLRAEFMTQETDAAARLGVDVIQIDDGWQIGATSNSVRAQSAGGVWEGFYAARENFWTVNPERFPDGLGLLVRAAREKGMRFGLWFAPDSSDDFAHWQLDADTICQLYQELGIEYIKIDGVKLRSKTGERHLRAFFDDVLNKTAGRVIFDLDVTAETRPGYFGQMQVGPLFVENRYTDWRKYWPHQTLRNLWKLTHHIAPERLRMEFLNHARHDEKYFDDPLAPSNYRPDYLFATVMFSSPLGWFEASNLPETYFDEVAPLISTWKAHRDAIFSGTIVPIGDAPDGVVWTGFVSLAPDRRSAYVLVFREASPSPNWQVSVPFSPEATQSIEATCLGGDGGATLSPNGALEVVIPEARRFLFAQICI